MLTSLSPCFYLIGGVSFFLSFFLLVLFCCFKQDAQASLQLVTLLAQPPKCLGYRFMPLYQNNFLKAKITSESAWKVDGTTFSFERHYFI